MAEFPRHYLREIPRGMLTDDRRMREFLRPHLRETLRGDCDILGDALKHMWSDNLMQMMTEFVRRDLKEMLRGSRQMARGRG